MKVSRINIQVLLVVVVGILSISDGIETDKFRAPKLKPRKYLAISCRNHSASITDFGGVGDGKTSNTKAFKAAVEHLSKFANSGGAELVVPAGRWLTGSFNLTSYFTLFLAEGAVILGTEDPSEWPLISVLPSYGRGRDAPGNGSRYSALIYGTNLTDVVVTGNNGTIDGQGQIWWDKFHNDQLNYTRPYMIEILFSDRVQISNLTLLNSPSWFVHPVYSSNIIIKGLRIVAPYNPVSPNTDGIDPDSCTNTLIEDCYIESGDDCVAVKSGWDQYGIAVGMPTTKLLVRRVTCVSPDSAGIALGSEMSGGIQDVRVEDFTAINTQAGVRIKTAIGRGGYVKDVFMRRMVMKTMKYVLWMTGAYGSHPDESFDPKAIPVINNINYIDMVAENVNMTANLAGLAGHPFTGICLSNVAVGMSVKPKKIQWNCTDIEGTAHNVTPQTCSLLPDGNEANAGCHFPTDRLPIEDLPLKLCTHRST
ncbi:hypothetical protein GIB67_008308 [Kingdonia uniflora]|uniref:Polygalacturonase n=1 Tax=Kingdonia uniflora TaxID=39325 RepID=A0A7J7N4R0_9MAGN|nr:hypothetical protein GIB67_008308 [Kingdonia uniflora]